ncbi:DUF4114 domain-containing protein [Hassallia byssoidea VB512170]|uniref:DUF4114 domain-containing protein n=1 Tax=Hassallia byssoidea VB512170 TaxID=1304833 RepID=A0A846H5U0_9CYAN|nr:DUF4114 domain-containing protein [Hassalia byssoidea]NEU71959.1 DUF4114 domain-containing protein [Hassalia byssoidea VB512170]
MAFANSGNSSDLFNNISNSLGIDSLSASNSSLQVSTDYANALNINNYFKGSSSSPVIESANLETQFPVNSVTSSNAPFTSGWYTVGSTGKVSFDYLFDGGAYEGELAIFSLEGMGQYQLGSTGFIQEAVRRSLSDSLLGHVVISDSDEAARFSGNLKWDANHNLGEYRGLKNFAMRPGDQFGIMQVPNGKVQELLNNPDIEGDKHPLFSLAPNNPLAASQFAQFRDINGSGRIFAMEDLRQDGTSDNDFNDFVFYMEGAIGDAPLLDNLIDKNHDWRSADVGKKISEWNPTPPDSNDKIGRPIPPDNRIKPPDNTIKPPSFQDGDLVKGSDEKVYLIQSSSRRLIPNPGIFQEMGFKKDAIKTLDDKDLNSISVGDNLPIPAQYQESANVANEWRSDLYWWDGNGTPSLDFSSNSNNLFATLNLGENTRGDGKKGINFDWGAGSPKGDDKLLNDNFAIAAYTEATFDGGTYNFQASGDDGFQVFVKKKGTDEPTYLTSKDKWQQAYGSPWKTEATLQGNYELYFIYYEERGDARFNLSWEKKAMVPKPPVVTPPLPDLIKPPIIEPPTPPTERSFSKKVLFNLIDQDLGGKGQVNNPSLNLGDSINLLEKYPVGVGNLSSTFDWKVQAFLSNGNFDVKLPSVFDISYVDAVSSGSTATIKFKSVLEDATLSTDIGLSLLGLAKLKAELNDPVVPLPIPLKLEFGREFDAIPELSQLAKSPISFDLGLGATDNYIEENQLFAEDDAFQSFDIVKFFALAANVGVALTGGGAALIPIIKVVEEALEAAGISIDAGLNINQASTLDIKGFEIDFDEDKTGDELQVPIGEEKEIEVQIPSNYRAGETFKVIPKVRPITEFISQLNFTGKLEGSFDPKWIPGFDTEISLGEFGFPDPPFTVPFSDKFDPFQRFSPYIYLPEINFSIV